MTPPREVPGWDEFLMGLAFYYAGKSKDVSTQCGAVVVDKNHVPLGFGFNGPPRQIPDAKVDWSRPAKYSKIRHAEASAIDHCRTPTLDGLEGCTIYVTGHPCAQCMLKIVGRGISRVVYGPQGIAMLNDTETRSSQEIAKDAGILLEKLPGNLRWAQHWTNRMESMGLFRDNMWE